MINYLKIVLVINFVFFASCNIWVERDEGISRQLPPLNEKQTSNNDCQLNFEKFFEAFSADPKFQKSRVKYPMNWSYIEDLETNKIGVDTIKTEKDFRYIDFTKDKNAITKKSNKYTVETKVIDSTLVHYYWFGLDNGIRITYKFRLIDNCWSLIEILDESS